MPSSPSCAVARIAAGSRPSISAAPSIMQRSRSARDIPQLLSSASVTDASWSARISRPPSLRASSIVAVLAIGRSACGQILSHAVGLSNPTYRWQLDTLHDGLQVFPFINGALRPDAPDDGAGGSWRQAHQGLAGRLPRAEADRPHLDQRVGRPARRGLGEEDRPEEARHRARCGRKSAWRCRRSRRQAKVTMFTP